MERFGRPRFRGAAAPKPYGNRPASSQGRPGGLLGPPPRPSGGGQFGSYQDSKPKRWDNPRSNNSSGSLLGDVPGSSYNPSQRSSSAGGRPHGAAVPSEVHQLMQTLGLSQSDMEKLSQLPENELSVNNLAKAIGNLKHGNEGVGGRSSFSSPHPTAKRSDSFQRDRGQNRGFRNNDSILGNPPDQDRFQDRSGRRSPSGNRSFESPGNRHKPTGIKVTVKPTDQQIGGRSRMMDSKSGSNFPDRRQFTNKDQRDEFFEEQRLYGRKRSTDRFEQPRNDSFSQNSRRVNEPNFDSREVHGKQSHYANERRVERVRETQQRGPQGPMHRPVGTRNVSKASALPSLLDLPTSPKSRSGGGGLLGNPPSGPQGLEKLVAAVGGNSLLTPLMLATQADPSVLEAQIQAMKALQAQAIKMQSGGPQSRDKGRPMRRSPPRSRAAVIARQLEEDARMESQIMRSAKGRVLYIKYKSPRVSERDLRQLAAAFGRVTKLFIIKPKIKNGHFQAFMEMDSWDCAAAMLERYLSKPPNIKGCPVDVQRSNYPDLQLKYEQFRSKPTKRLRSKSPIRRGTTQLPMKREKRGDDKPSLSITTSRSERRIVSQDDKQTKQQGKGRKTDAREILNRRSTQDKKGEDAKDSSSETKDTTEVDGEADENKDEDSKDETNAEESKKESEAEKSKDDIIDPLDALADELALHDEFVLMDEVGYERNRKKGDDEKKIAPMDLDESGLDLDNVNVEMSQDEEETEEGYTKIKKVTGAQDQERSPTEVVKDIVMEILDKIVDHEEKTDEEKTEPEEVELNAQSALEEEMAALQEFNANEDEIHEYVYNDDSVNEENESTEDPPSNSDAEIQKLQELISDSLKEIHEAKDHLDTLVKVTKAKAAQAVAKKLRVCLEVAISNMENAETAG